MVSGLCRSELARFGSNYCLSYPRERRKAKHRNRPVWRYYRHTPTVKWLSGNDQTQQKKGSQFGRSGAKKFEYIVKRPTMMTVANVLDTLIGLTLMSPFWCDVVGGVWECEKQKNLLPNHPTARRVH